jgi:hypothetical protein
MKKASYGKKFSFYLVYFFKCWLCNAPLMDFSHNMENNWAESSASVSGKLRIIFLAKQRQEGPVP